jgi:hypothetical protein
VVRRDQAGRAGTVAGLARELELQPLGIGGMWVQRHGALEDHLHTSIFLDQNRRDIGKLSVNMDRFQPRGSPRSAAW